MISFRCCTHLFIITIPSKYTKIYLKLNFNILLTFIYYILCIFVLSKIEIMETLKVTKKQPIDQLALEVFAIIEGKIRSHDFSEDDTEVKLEAEICIEGKDFGTVKFEVYQNVLTQSGGGYWDEAPYGFEADYQVFDIKAEIYNEGKLLPNVTKSVNRVLFENYYGKTI